MSNQNRIDVEMSKDAMRELMMNPYVTRVADYPRQLIEEARQYEYCMFFSPMGRIHFSADIDKRITLSNIEQMLRKILENCHGDSVIVKDVILTLEYINNILKYE